ncbi:nucleoid occlusion protein [Listeria fleischmannii]|uniref:Chromosome partition protein n=1 Tax=Listeria fleischmannii FSL S10-1203 TaxID=1265822 RepID=W7DUA0_9LIST|nr:nucleoid occlusion protein [Listeria fleischmannii]EUJ51425.1 chromosome partition protein [Listeria fleischmannii FSL S10-1203]
MAFSLFGKKDRKENNEAEETSLQKRVEELSLDSILPNQFQPRTVFNEDKIQELAETIQVHGIIQPIVVREMREGGYEIIAGERRYRAARHLNLETIPAIIQDFNDDDTASIALIENLQREQLTPIEEAKAYNALLDMQNVTQGDLAKQVGKSQSAIANKLRLLKLPKEVQDAVLAKDISERHARALLALETEAQQMLVLNEIINQHFNVKQTDELIQEILTKKEETPKPKKPQVRAVSRDVRIALNTIKESVKMVQKSGLDLNIDEQESEEFFEITIQIPKNKS